MAWEASEGIAMIKLFVRLDLVSSQLLFYAGLKTGGKVYLFGETMLR